MKMKKSEESFEYLGLSKYKIYVDAIDEGIKNASDSPLDCTNVNCLCKSRKKENEGLKRES